MAHDDYSRLRTLRRLGQLYAVAFLVVGVVAAVLPYELGLGTAHWSTSQANAYDQAKVDQLAYCLFSVMGAWSILAIIGVAVRGRLSRWACRAE